MLQITRQISKYNYSSGNNIKYIVIHDTGNYKDTAKNNADYFGGGDRQASAHYFVDDNSVIQVVEDFNASWHCSDGGMQYGIGNHNSIGIEMCNSGGYISEMTINNTVDLVRHLMQKYNVPIGNVVRHYDASRKVCPNNMSANNWAKWNEFKSKLAGGTSSSEETNDYGVATVTAQNGVNIRRGATTSYAVVGTLPNGVNVRIALTYGNWANIYFGNNNKGWVCMDFLNVYKVFKKPTPPQKPPLDIKKESNKLYRVQVGAYKNKDNAEALLKELKSKGFEGFIKEE